MPAAAISIPRTIARVSPRLSGACRLPTKLTLKQSAAETAMMLPPVDLAASSTYLLDLRRAHARLRRLGDQSTGRRATRGARGRDGLRGGVLRPAGAVEERM